MPAEYPLLGISQRQPPANPQAEQALLGALLANNKAFDAVSGFLREEHFADPIHGRIYGAIARRVDAGQLADAITLKREFEHDGVLEEVGGAQYLAQLLSAMVGIINAGEYGRAIRDAWHRRALIAIGEELVNACFAPAERGAAEIQEAAEEALARLADGMEVEAVPVPAGEAMRLAIDEAWRAREALGGLVGWSTGLRALDDATGGLRAPDLVVLGARPSMGKTSLALRIAEGAAATGARVGLFSYEMSAADLGAQLAAGLTPVPRDLATRGKLRERDELGRFRWRAMEMAEYDAMFRASRAMGERKLVLLDMRSRTLQSLRAAVRRLRRRGGLDLVVIDYLQLMTVPELMRFDNRTEMTTRLVGGIKAMAKEFGLPVVLLSQLNRGVEGREVKRPQLSDLRDSGAIEQDADVVMFLHRDEYYLDRLKIEREKRESDEDLANRRARHEARLRAARGLASIYIDKLRKGRIGEVAVRFDGETTWFRDLEEDGPP